MSDLNIYVSTSNEHLHAIKPFQFLFNKFWGENQNVTILGYRPPDIELYNNFKFVSLREEQGPVEEWAVDLREFFESIDDEYFIYCMEDHFIMEPVDFDVLSVLFSYIEHETFSILTGKTSKVGRIGLTNDIQYIHGKQYEPFETKNEVKVINKTPTAEYRISTQFSLWSKEYMLRYLLPGMTPWEFELNGSESALSDGYLILSTEDRHAIKHAQAIRKGDTSKFDFTFVNDYDKSLDPTTLKEMQIKGII
jgi:hypothetical protein